MDVFTLRCGDYPLTIGVVCYSIPIFFKLRNGQKVGNTVLVQPHVPFAKETFLVGGRDTSVTVPLQDPVNGTYLI